MQLSPKAQEARDRAIAKGDPTIAMFLNDASFWEGVAAETARIVAMDDDQLDAYYAEQEAEQRREDARFRAEQLDRQRAYGIPDDAPRDRFGMVEPSTALHYISKSVAQREQEIGWQANPDGLSGRVVRGYKHWRRKR